MNEAKHIGLDVRQATISDSTLSVAKGKCCLLWVSFRLIGSYRDWIETVRSAFSTSGFATDSHTLHAGNHFPSSPR